jgi:hypothetical protein
MKNFVERHKVGLQNIVSEIIADIICMPLGILAFYYIKIAVMG